MLTRYRATRDAIRPVTPAPFLAVLSRDLFRRVATSGGAGYCPERHPSRRPIAPPDATAPPAEPSPPPPIAPSHRPPPPMHQWHRHRRRRMHQARTAAAECNRHHRHRRANAPSQHCHRRMHRHPPSPPTARRTDRRPECTVAPSPPPQCTGAPAHLRRLQRPTAPLLAPPGSTQVPSTSRTARSYPSAGEAGPDRNEAWLEPWLIQARPRLRRGRRPHR